MRDLILSVLWLSLGVVALSLLAPHLSPWRCVAAPFLGIVAGRIMHHVAQSGRRS